MEELERYLNLPYSIEVTPDQTTDGAMCYLARHLELPGCMSHGETPEEAIANLSEAKKLYIQVLLDKKQPIPSPRPSLYQAIWTVIPVSGGQGLHESRQIYGGSLKTGQPFGEVAEEEET
jgi:predicted RNase H-like HicB family nuclease